MFLSFLPGEKGFGGLMKEELAASITHRLLCRLADGSLGLHSLEKGPRSDGRGRGTRCVDLVSSTEVRWLKSGRTAIPQSGLRGLHQPLRNCAIRSHSSPLFVDGRFNSLCCQSYVALQWGAAPLLPQFQLSGFQAQRRCSASGATPPAARPWSYDTARAV